MNGTQYQFDATPRIVYSAHMAGPPYKTEGARLLTLKIEKLIKASKGKLERQQIAAQLDVDPNTLGHWLAERRRPTIDQAVIVQRVLNIKMEAWAQPGR